MSAPPDHISQSIATKIITNWSSSLDDEAPQPSPRKASQFSPQTDGLNPAGLPFVPLSPGPGSSSASSAIQNQHHPFDIYQGLSSFTFGQPSRSAAPSPSPSYDADAEPDEYISPLTPIPPRRPSADRTPRPSVFVANSSHPSQGPGGALVPPLPATSGISRNASSSYVDASGSSRPRVPRVASSASRPQASRTRPSRGSDWEDPIMFYSTLDREPSRDFYPRFERERSDNSDAASRRTFGGPADGSLHEFSSSTTSVSSADTRSRRTSPQSSRIDFSSDESELFDSEYADEEDHPTSPFAGPHDVIDEEEEYGIRGSARESYLSQRRGSLPMAIPGSSEAANVAAFIAIRDREGSLATLRRQSRSLDDDFKMPSKNPPLGLGSTTGSAPTSTALAGLLDDDSESASDGVLKDLTLQEVELLAQDQLLEQGFDTSYILGGGIDAQLSRRPSEALSYVQPLPPRKDSRSLPSSGSLAFWARRKSAASVMTVEDSFTKFVRTGDEAFGLAWAAWTFKMELADQERALDHADSTQGLTSPRASMGDVPDAERRGKRRLALRGMKVGTQEIWRCEFVGRFKADRLENIRKCLRSEPRSSTDDDVSSPADPSKPPQQRLQLKHVLDPFSRGNTRGGPQAIVHKHSRANAFSIYRGHKLTTHNRHAMRGTAAIKSSQAILLAPKRVQEEYTSTRSTVRLNTYGYLEDKGRSRDGASRDKRERDRTREKRKEKRPDSKLRAQAEAASGSIGGPGNGTKSVAGSIISAQGTLSSVGSSASSTTQTPSMYYTPTSTIVPRSSVGHDGGVEKDLLAGSSSNARPRVIGPPPQPDPEQTTLPSAEVDDSADEDSVFPFRQPRRTYEETYTTLDSTVLEEARVQAGTTDPNSNQSFFRRLLRPGQKSALNASESNMGRKREEYYTPPWITMAPRQRQEEKERVIQNLNESFKDVGLLPQIKPHVNKKGSRSKMPAALNIFEKVPNDSLYMLLPLWPGETDPASALPTDSQALGELAVHDRRYLLVWYVIRDQAKSRVKKQRTPNTSSGESNPPPGENGILLVDFAANAQLVSYEEFRGTGIRLPSDGLSVTGPLSEAMKYLPSSPVPGLGQTTYLIATCKSRAHGVVLIPEGLAACGLSLPMPRLVSESDPCEEPDVVLSPVGRAAVEMVWAGCMALTSFG